MVACLESIFCRRMVIDIKRQSKLYSFLGGKCCLDKAEDDEEVFERLKKVSGVSLLQSFVGSFLERTVKVEYKHGDHIVDK